MDRNSRTIRMSAISGESIRQQIEAAMENSSRLNKALEQFRARRKYAEGADTDYDIAQANVVEAQGDLLEAIVEYLLASSGFTKDRDNNGT